MGQSLYTQWRKYWFQKLLLAEEICKTRNDWFNELTIKELFRTCKNNWKHTSKWSQADREYLEIYIEQPPNVPQKILKKFIDTQD